ncbi:MAG: tRNA 4-thiouridine(8) synthase ThiI [Elusimicrobiota bacterium]
MKKSRAIILISGGLDSTLAAHVMKSEPVEMLAVFFKNPFTGGKNSNNEAISRETAEKLDIPFRVIELSREYLDIVVSPEHGYGKHMNPCIDCRIYMLKNARKIMEEEGYDFIITGEVAGQRPMSQNNRAMNLIEKEAGLEGSIYRPLSAGILDCGSFIEKGLISGESMLLISGRSRKKQFALAQKFGLNRKEYSSPAGGCRLTTEEYSKKFKDLIDHNNAITLTDIEFLAIGRHFRLDVDFKVIIGRNRRENDILEKLASGDVLKMHAAGYMGPTCIGLGIPDIKKIGILAGICGRYADCPEGKKAGFEYLYMGEKGYIEVLPFDESRIKKYKIY